ncbi:unnamed protein product [Symbiodinium necroappetens]|uniref:Uncharacterized protein n=1 Tax=Symbiodinium necroappetens TaxID=1628268 RepID=A0A812KL52_9DINO|nr:unnamed protein product [Symbiodinium necroappetens]
MHLLLIRHGQSKNNVLEAEHGAGSEFNNKRSIDPPLSDLGILQAELLGKRLGAQLRSSRKRLKLMCSSMTRALQTIEPLAKELQLPVTVHPDVHEVKGFYNRSGEGPVCGSGKQAIERQFPGFDASLIQNGQGPETIAEAAARGARLVKMLKSFAKSGHDEDILVIVSHNDLLGLLGRLLLVPSGAALDVAATEPEQLFNESYWPMNNTGISHFVLGLRPPAGAYQVDVYLLYWNRSDHMSECHRSGVQLKNIGFTESAEWARVGRGGSKRYHLFRESAVVHCHGFWKAEHCLRAQLTAYS